MNRLKFALAALVFILPGCSKEEIEKEEPLSPVPTHAVHIGDYLSCTNVGTELNFRGNSDIYGGVSYEVNVANSEEKLVFNVDTSVLRYFDDKPTSLNLSDTRAYLTRAAECVEEYDTWYQTDGWMVTSGVEVYKEDKYYNPDYQNTNPYQQPCPGGSFESGKEKFTLNLNQNESNAPKHYFYVIELRKEASQYEAKESHALYNLKTQTALLSKITLHIIQAPKAQKNK